MTTSLTRYPLLWLIAAAFLVRLYQISSPLADWHSFRQADTASVAREYVKHGIDLLRPRYHDLSNIQSGLDNVNGYRMVEFPLIPALVAVTYQPFISLTGLPLHVWYRLISVAFSLASIGLLYALVTDLYHRRLGILAAAVFAFLPNNIYYSRTTLPEVSLVTFYLASLLSGRRFAKSGNLGWAILTVIFGALAMLIKPMAAFMLLPLLPTAIIPFKTSFRRLPFWLFLVTVMVIPLYLWRGWLTRFPEGVPISAWLLNGNGIRLRPAWFRWLFYERLTKLILGYTGIIPFLTGLFRLYTAKKTANWWFILFWLFGALGYLIIFATGNVQHDYYQVILIPLISILVASGLHWLFMRHHAYLKILTISVSLIAFVIAWNQVKGYYQINHWAIVQAGRAADRLLPQDALVIAPYRGDTAFLYQTNRRGWPIGYDLDKKIRLGAGYYITVNYDDEARQLENTYKTLEKNNDYLIFDLTQPLFPQ